MTAPVPHPDVHHRAARRILNAAPAPNGMLPWPYSMSWAGAFDRMWGFAPVRNVSLAEAERIFPPHKTD